MNKLHTTVAVATLIFGLGASAHAKDTSEEMRDVSSFKEVHLNGSMDVEITVGGSQSVKVIADSDIIDHVRTEVRGDTLKLDMDRGSYRNIKTMRVLITVPALTGAEVHGSGDLYVTGAKSDRFGLGVQGSGDAVFKDATLGKLDIELQGSGDVHIEGSCDQIKVEVQGSGDVEATKMKCKSADVSVHGSGDVAVFASGSIDVSIHGSGDVSVQGSPDKVNSKVRGSGDVTIR